MTAAPATWAARAAIALVGLAAVESIAALRGAADPGAAAWPDVAAAIDGRGDDDPVFVAQAWLSPMARLHVPAAAELTALAGADLHGVPRFHVIGWDTAWSASLTDALEGLPEPTLEQHRGFGPLVWASYVQPAAGTVLARLDDAGLTVHSDGGPCRGRGRYKCAEGDVEPRIAEIDYLPRACWGVAVRDGTAVRLRWHAAQLGEQLRGHVGLSDYNARLRNDAPVLLVVRIDGDEVLRATVTDMQGWWPFSIPTTAGQADVEIELRAGLSGTFTAAGYDGTPSRVTCVEARTIAGGP